MTAAATFWDRLRHALGHYPTTAREWAVRVQAEDVTREELLALEEWLKADPRNAEAYARVNKIAHLGLMYRDHPEERQRLNTYRRPAPRPEPRMAHRWRIAVASAATLAAMAIGIVFVIGDIYSSSRYVAGRGEQRQVALADGSRMLVNTDSEVRVRYADHERLVELVRGEAYFEVAKDHARPFLVRSQGTVVRAVGTKFTVRRGAEVTEVVVTEGLVQVLREDAASLPRAGAASIELESGKRAVVALAQTEAQVAFVDTARATAWTTGNVEFDEAKLSDVIHEINRYAAMSFVLDDPALTEIRVTGRFRIGDLESVKFALRDRFGIVATEARDAIHLARGN